MVGGYANNYPVDYSRTVGIIPAEADPEALTSLQRECTQRQKELLEQRTASSWPELCQATDALSRLSWALRQIEPRE